MTPPKKDENKVDGVDADEIEVVDDADTAPGEGQALKTNTQTPPANPQGGAQAEIAELKKQHLYLMADFDNYRKQAIKERSELIKYGHEPIVREFLGVLDNMERAAGTLLTAESMETYKNGVDMIVTQFKKVLERFGVEEVDPKGQPFDPSMHEALGSDNNPDLPPNAVTQVLKKAYKLRGKVIRPAQVIVNSTPTS